MKITGRYFSKGEYVDVDLSHLNHIVFGEGQDQVIVEARHGEVQVLTNGLGRHLAVLPRVANVITVKSMKT